MSRKGSPRTQSYFTPFQATSGTAAPEPQPAAPTPPQTPAAPQAPSYAQPLPATKHSTPEWHRQAMEMAHGLHALLHDPNPPPHIVQAVQRAHYAWSLGGYTAREVERVTRLVERAWSALRGNPGVDPGAYLLCAEVLHRGLPRKIRSRQRLPDVVRIVRHMHQQSIESVAQRDAVTMLLGFDEVMNHWTDSLRPSSAPDR